MKVSITIPPIFVLFSQLVVFISFIIDSYVWSKHSSSWIARAKELMAAYLKKGEVSENISLLSLTKL